MPGGLPVFEQLLILGGLLVLLLLALAPLETLLWWSGWYGGRIRRQLSAAVEELPEPNIGSGAKPTGGGSRETAKFFAVYLSGTGDVAGNFLFPEEKTLLERLRARLPRAVIVDDVFPYSVVRQALTGQRPLAWLWRRLIQQRALGDNVFASLINVRNFTQMLVSSDRRYGPLYGLGAARRICASLQRLGYRPGEGAPVTLIGYSGGAQICLSASIFLRVMLRAPIQIVSIGGVMCDDPAVLDLAHLYHLYGGRDWVQGLDNLVFPGKWPLLGYSAWNRARRAGRITNIRIGPMKHHGPGAYMDDAELLPSGKSYLDITADHIEEIIRRAEQIRFPRGRMAGLAGLESVRSQTWDFDSRPDPALGFDDALARVESLQSLDGAHINPRCGTTLLHHGAKTETAFVLLHGFTNCPQQWRAFGRLLHGRGTNVLIPRLPRHGYADRLSGSIADLTAEELLVATDTAVDIAQGLGGQVTVMGLSLGGLLAAWASLERDDIHRVALVAPSFSFHAIPAPLEGPVVWLAGAIPGVFLWWNSQLRAASKPDHAYPRFPTRTLWHMRRIARDVEHESERLPPRAREVLAVTNGADRAVRNAAVEWLVDQWRTLGHPNISTHHFSEAAGLPHDFIDPGQPDQQVERVYPALLGLLGLADETRRALETR